MIVTHKQAKYHLSYLKSLKTLRSRHWDNELLNDGIHLRLLLSRLSKAGGAEYDNMVTIEADVTGKGDWAEVVSQYPADTGPLYCVPANCGLASTDRAVAAKLAKLLAALCTINTNRLSSGAIIDDCDTLGMKIKNTLVAQGWRITATDNG